MAGLMRCQDEEPKEPQPFQESSRRGLSDDYINTFFQLIGQINHDKLCDAMHEQVLNSETTATTISSLSLQTNRERSQNDSVNSKASE
ncbi:hypothetical protein IEQ34_016397 [Dendrobium chrysotoxum]|uniref:Uncharacterized protein n=1 Tax=Dendrobium chrysotoxum TaxID=161865 RepID=A0AAV7GGD7_DENCH|nr:hypothetical protein IEQ34_016397 [Dendrobium chrysotoxum]